ncbi:MAG TPA: glycosyltransferase family 39 protein [Solirubrobacteraceae bacterium]
MTGTTSEPLAAPAPAAGRRTPGAELAGMRGRLRSRDDALRLGGLAVVLAVSSVLNIVRLSQNGYANLFYSAGVRSMLRSWHNFFFVASDPAGLVTVDKPPLGLWVQAASAKLFGFSPLSLLLPEALLGVATAAVLYVIVARRFGTAAGLAAGVVCAVFPSFVAVSRSNGVDPLLIFLMLLACAAAIRACESGHWRSVLLAGVLVGLAFNTKTLAAYLVVPSIAVGYLVCGPAALSRRVLQLLAAGVLAGAVSFAWIAVVEATPASERPYVGSSTDNSELGLTFNYNGFGRVEGQAGGPGQTHGEPGGRVPKSVELRFDRRRARELHVVPPPSRKFPPTPHKAGRESKPVPFGGPRGPLRLFGVGLGDQAGWLLPFAVFGLIAALLALLLPRGGPRRPDEDAAPYEPRPAAGTPGLGATLRPARGEATAAPRRDPRLAATIVLGGWFFVEAAVISASKGIVHPYYASALAPGTGASVGIGAWALADLCRRRAGAAPILGIALAGAAVLGTLAAEVVLMKRYDYARWFIPVLVALTLLCLCGLAAVALAGRGRGRAAALVLAAVLALLLVVPAGYASTTWLEPVQSTFPAAGPKQAAGQGGIGLSPKDLAQTRALLSYVESHGATRRFALLTVSAPTAAPMILLGHEVAGLAGYSGGDPTMDGPGLARLIARREARYVLLGGEYASRGGNAATRAVLKACRELAPFEWHSPTEYPGGLVLFDCGGRERELAAQR